jgi:HK97 family phage major capsid protein
MTVTVRHLLEKKARIAAEMREMVDGAAGDTGALSPEQQAAFDKMKAALVELENAVANRSLVEDLERRMTGTPLGGGHGDRNFDREIRNFSIVRAIAAASGIQGVDAGREREISAELVRRSGRQFEGIAVPLAALRKPVEQRVVTSTGTAGTAGAGGSLIMTDLDGNQYIPALYAALVIRSLGARVLEGLVGNVDIPRLSDSSSAGWVAENTALTESDQGFDKVSLRPHHAGAFTEISRTVLMQSTPDVESLVRADFAQVLARALDNAAINGTGGTMPTGILQTSGIGSVAIGTNGGPITWAAVLELIEAIELGNVGDDSRAFLGNPKVKALAMQTPKVAGVALGFVQDEPDKMAGYRYASTTQVSAAGTKGSGTGLSTLLYGNWSDVLIGLWSELDILVNPYAETAYTKGNVQVRAMLTCDIALRHPASFAAITDIAAP